MNDPKTEINEVPLIKVAVLNRRIAEQVPRVTGGALGTGGDVTAADVDGEVLGHIEALNDVLIRRTDGRLARVMTTTFILTRHGTTPQLVQAGWDEVHAMRQLFLN